MEQLTLTLDVPESDETSIVEEKKYYCSDCGKEKVRGNPIPSNPRGELLCPNKCENKRRQAIRDRGEDQTSTRDRAMKLKINEHGGGQCLRCGYNECPSSLEFHHINPLLKSFEVKPSEIRGKTWDEITDEMEKCILLCANCHRYEHYLINNGNITQEYSEYRLKQIKHDFFKQRESVLAKFNIAFQTWYKKIGQRIFGLGPSLDLAQK